MKIAILFSIVAVAAGTSACSSIVDGTTQKITVNTNPPGADCGLKRQDSVFVHVNPTPGTVTVDKTKYDITIICNKEGYQETTFLNHSGVAGATLGNIVLGGGIGWAIDSADGADNKYESPVNMTLNPMPAKETSSK